ncbi:uncharacterized protein BJ171DRAFT_519011 [Polychytrium aggregatum]|uniref:uncharacterized protein n=1 Tax=Polychytrium aggregatum TaxID=110093 RepID=UPI0022FE47EA|nr:uncharacterized protein BJ171DRAFT_519011 [Polychytrium aggregatum]KAI9199398.1 hypothetical protein BJ171DRAFT_519011 [Polychytrium aggregatum]
MAHADIELPSLQPASPLVLVVAAALIALAFAVVSGRLVFATARTHAKPSWGGKHPNAASEDGSGRFADASYPLLAHPDNHPLDDHFPAIATTDHDDEPDDFLQLYLIEKIMLDYRTAILRFQAPYADSFASGCNFALRLCTGSRTVVQPYTVTSSSLGGIVSIIVRLPLLEDAVKATSKHLITMELDDTVEAAPLVNLFPLNPFRQPRITLIGAGNGVVPLFALIRFIINHSATIQLHLIFFSRDPESPLFEEFMRIAESSLGRLSVDFALEPSSWDEAEALIASNLPDLETAAAVVEEPSDEVTGGRSAVFVCGSLQFEYKIASIIKRLGFPRSLVWSFGLDGR